MNPDAGKEIKAVWRESRDIRSFLPWAIPTALLALEEELRKGFRPELIIAVPVGFVNVVPQRSGSWRPARRQVFPVSATKAEKGNVAPPSVCNMYKMHVIVSAVVDL